MKPQRSALALAGLLLAASLPMQALAAGPVAPAAAPAPEAAPAAPPAAPPAAEGRHYQLGDFDTIDISGAAHVRFRQGESDSVFIEGDEAVQKGVSVDVRSGQLNIRPSGGWKFWNPRRVQVHVTARELRRVKISGAADLQAPGPVQLGQLFISISGAGLARFDQLQAQQLSFQVSGAGDGQVAGRVEELSVSVSGRSDFRGEALMAQRARVRVSGIAEVKVWVLQDLQVNVSGVGTVDYWGNPEVQRNTSGVARINGRGPKPLP